MAAISAEVRATATGVAGFAILVGIVSTGVPVLSAAAADARAVSVDTTAGAWPSSPWSAVIGAVVRAIATAAQVLRAEVAVVATLVRAVRAEVDAASDLVGEAHKPARAVATLVRVTATAVQVMATSAWVVGVVVAVVATAA